MPVSDMASAASAILLALCTLSCVSGFVLRQADLPGRTNCQGGFDVYFVLDTSGSIDGHQQQSVDFAEDLTSRFTSANLRVSFITFADHGTVQLPLTGDRNKIQEGLQRLRGIKPKGSTVLSKGLSLAQEQIETGGDSTASVVIALTDGQIGRDKDAAEIQANSIRRLGGSVLAVRVGESSAADLLGVADMPPETHIFQGDSFDDLENIIAQIIDTSCVEILSVTPDVVCSQDTFNVSIYGNGFYKTLNIDAVFCSFKINGTDQRVKPFNVTPTYLLCQSPRIPEEGGIIELQVSVNGMSFVSSNVTITAEECEPPNFLPAIFSFLGALLLLALLLLWWFWNLLCCAVVKKDPEPAEEPTSSPIVTPAPPKPETPKLVPGPPVVKKWPKVDVSLIGGAGAGGIRPVPVRWGAGGNTEAARHLEKAKQAEVVGQIEIETPGELVPAKPETLKRGGSKYPGAATGDSDGCCSCFSTKIFGKCLAPIKSLYDKVSLMRPQPGDKGICCACK